MYRLSGYLNLLQSDYSKGYLREFRELHLMNCYAAYRLINPTEPILMS